MKKIKALEKKKREILKNGFMEHFKALKETVNRLK